MAIAKIRKAPSVLPATKSVRATDRIAAEMGLGDLLLDVANPRFGDERSDLPTQIAVLDHIVANYGVDDVISSLAVNGYFKAEPLVGRLTRGKTVIVEGNRRLAACLILANEPRAANQSTKGAQYRKLWTQHGRPSIDPVPVISFGAGDSEAELLSYLGVRHISASTPWDSYAKASWAAKVVATTSLTVSDISTMIGDPNRTVARLLEGYYVVRQAIKEGYFEPADSVRRGRGSVTEYPFSWVYTILGYTAARKYLAMPENGPVADPLPKASLPKAQFVLRAMFGSQAKGLNAVIRDSRALGDLASALLDPDKVKLMSHGTSLIESVRVTRPLEERILENLGEVKRFQAEIIAVLAEEDVPTSIAESCIKQASSNRRSAAQIEKTLREVIFPENEDD